MALTTIADKSIGSKIYLQETADTKAGYIVAMHDYRGENCLLVRCENLSAQKFYTSGTSDASYKKSALNTSLSDTWVAALSAEAAGLLASVTLPDGTVTKAFVPSCCEFGVNGSSDERDSVVLSSAAISAIAETRKGTKVWARDIEDTGDYDEENGTWEHNRDSAYYLSFSSSGSVSTSYTSVTDSNPVLVCIAVPETLVLGEDDVLRANHAPVIECENGESDDIGAKSLPFRFGYTVTDADGDSVTVTETVGTTVIKSYTATLGETVYFTVGQAIFDALDEDQYYTLSITATDGAGTAVMTTRFLKTAQRGYRVYAGTISKWVKQLSSTGMLYIANGGYVFSEKICIYDPTWSDESRLIFDPTMTFEQNNYGSFEFTVPKENVYYDKFDIRKTVVTVEEDGATLWTGYVLEVSKDFKMDKVIYCRGEMGYLEDICCAVSAKEWDAKSLFTAIVGATSGNGIKSFRVGDISEEYASETVDTTDSGTQYTTVWGALNDILLANTGGTIRLRIRRDKTDDYGVGYTRYLDFLSDVDDKTNQTIEFGRNLLDLNYYMSGYDIVNQVKVYGYETTGWWFWKKTSPISVTVKDAASIEKYGVIERSVFVEGTKSSTDDLTAVGNKQLKELNKGLAGGIEISALDLKDAGVDVNRLGFLKKAHLISTKHGIDEWELCTKMELPLDDAANKKFTFGETIDAISVQQAAGSSSTRRALSGMESIISYINGTS